MNGLAPAIALSVLTLAAACDKKTDEANPAAGEAGGAEAKAEAQAAVVNSTGTARTDLELPAVDEQGASALGEALQHAEPHQRPVLAAAGLAEIETERLPSPFIEGLEAIQNAPPEMRAQLLAKALSESMSMMDHMCGDGRSLMQSLATMAPEQRGGAIHEGCNLDRHALVAKSEMNSRDAMMVLMGSLVFDHLSRGGELHAGERAAVEAMVSAPAESE